MESHLGGDWTSLMWDPLELVRLGTGERGAGAVCPNCPATSVDSYAAFADTYICLPRWRSRHTRAGVAPRCSLPRGLRRLVVSRSVRLSKQYHQPPQP